ALEGAQVILVPSASPARGTGRDEEGARLPASVVRWERIVRSMAEEHGVWVVLANLVGFEGGKGFPGGSVVVSPGGELVLRGPLFEEAVLTYDLDLEELTRARAEAPLLADLEVNLPHLLKNLGKGEKGKGESSERRSSSIRRPMDRKLPGFPFPFPRFTWSGEGWRKATRSPLTASWRAAGS